MPDIPTIIDLLTTKKFSDKVKDVVDDRLNKSLDKFQKQLDKTLSSIQKDIKDIQSSKNEVEVDEDKIRDLIADEVGRILFRIYIKRNSWQ